MTQENVVYLRDRRPDWYFRSTQYKAQYYQQPEYPSDKDICIKAIKSMRQGYLDVINHGGDYIKITPAFYNQIANIDKALAKLKTMD